MLAHHQAPPTTIFSDGTYSKRNTLRSVGSSDDGDYNWRNSQSSILTDLTEAPFEYDNVEDSVQVSTIDSSKLLHTQTTADVWTADPPTRSVSLISVPNRIIIPSRHDLKPKPCDWPLTNGPASPDSIKTSKSKIEIEDVFNARLSLPPAAYDIALSVPRLPIVEMASRPSNIVPGWAKAYYSKGMSLPTTPSTIAALAGTNSNPEIRQEESLSSTGSSISGRIDSLEPRTPTIYHPRISAPRSFSQILQLVLFCLGFICPLMWFIGAFMPLPDYIRQAGVDEKEALVYRELFLYWRMVNRCMTIAGVVLSGAIIGLAIYGAKG